MAKRVPKIYLSGPVDNGRVKDWKKYIVQDSIWGSVTFLDPARHGLSPTKDSAQISDVNALDMSECDAACVYFPDNITAGTSIELFILLGVLKKDVLVFTDIPLNRMTPYVRNLCSDRLYSPMVARKAIDEWVKGWYERTDS